MLVGTRGTWHEVSVVHIEKSKKETQVGLAIVEDCVSPHESASAWLWLGLLATLVLASLILYETENPRQVYCTGYWRDSSHNSDRSVITGQRMCKLAGR